MKIVSNIRYVIAEYLKFKYKLRQIGGDPEENITVAIEESLITHGNGNQVWLCRATDTRHKHIRLDVLPARNSDNLKTFVKNHITRGSNITHEGWFGCSFSDDEDSVWTHEPRKHGHGDF